MHLGKTINNAFGLL